MPETWSVEKAAASAPVFSKDSPVPIVLTVGVEQKIGAFLDEFKSLEWMAGLVGEPKDGYYLVTDLVIPEQEGAGASIEVTAKGAEDMAKVKLLGWLHSHNQMPAFQSHTDVETAGMYDLSVTVNNKYEYYATLRVKLPVGGETHLQCEVVSESRFFVDKEFLETNKALVKEKTYVASDWNGASYWNHGVLNRARQLTQQRAVEVGSNMEEIPVYTDYAVRGDEVCGQCNGRFNLKKPAFWCELCQQPLHSSCRKSHSLFCNEPEEVSHFCN